MISSAKSFQKKRLGRRLILTAQAACDSRDLDTAFQVLRVTEILLQNGKMTAQDKHSIVGMIVGTHVQLWALRHHEHTGQAFTATSQTASHAIGL